MRSTAASGALTAAGLLNRGQLRVTTGGGAPLKVDRIDGLKIRDNLQPVTNPGQGIDLGSSTGVVVNPAEDVQFPPL